MFLEDSSVEKMKKIVASSFCSVRFVQTVISKFSSSELLN